MATIQAQIQVGPSHQARLPPIQDTPVELCESREDLMWKPDSISDVDLLMYLRASRSMAAFVGWCDGGSTDDGCAAASMDEITINSLQLLHENTYNTGRALQALVKVINPKSVDRRWCDEDAKRFVRGLKQHGKNFFKIRRDLLPGKTTAELVEYYYLWKKLSLTARPPTHRRRRVLRRQPPTPPTPPSSESVEEPTSPSDASDNEMESDEAADYVCSHCHATQSTTWFEVKDKPGTVICASCKSFRRASDASELPPYVFRPVKEGQPTDADQQLDSASSGGDGSPEMANSDECSAAVDRTTPSTSSSCSSRTGLSSDKTCPAVSKCSSPVVNFIKPEETSAMAVQEPAEGLSCDIQPHKPMPCKVDTVPELWKVPDHKTVPRAETAEDWKCADDRMQEPGNSAPVRSNYCPSDPIVKKELKDAEDQGSSRDTLPLVKAEINGEVQIPSPSSSQWQDSKINRAVASVAPCPSLTSPWKSGAGLALPPPLLPHSAPVSAACRSSPPVSLHGGALGDSNQMVFEENSDSEMDEVGTRSPSPEQRLIYEECHRSKRGVFMRRWFRGRNTCSRSDLEFLSLPESSKPETAQKARQSTVKPPPSGGNSASSTAVRDARRPMEVRKDDEHRKKSRTPTENRSFDAKITSTLMSMPGMDLPPGLPRGPAYQPYGPSPTPALQKLSEYIRPHAGAPPDVPRYMPYGAPVPQTPGVDPYMRMAGPLQCLPGPWDGVEKREREAVFEREMRGMEMLDKVRHEMAAQGLDRLLAMGPSNPLDASAWEDMQRMYGSLGLGAMPPGLGMPLPPGIFPPDLMQRERERIEMIRSSQEQQQQQQQQLAALAAATNRENAVAAAMAAAAANNRDVAAAMAAAGSRENAAVVAAMAAANNRDVAAAMAAANGRENAAIANAMAAAGSRENAAAIFQLFQKFSQDPVMLQRHLLALSSSKDQELSRMMEASSLIYHFARADPLAGAAAAAAATNAASVIPPGLPPQSQPQHYPVAPPQQDLMALTQHYERVYLDMLSRPPYNSDPIMAQQLMMQMSQHHDAVRHQLAMDRDALAAAQAQPPPSHR